MQLFLQLRDIQLSYAIEINFFSLSLINLQITY